MAILICNTQTIPVHSRLLHRLARHTLRQLKLSKAELSLALVDDAEIRRLNRLYRRLDRATDVLAFGQNVLAETGQHWLGDVVISVETARRRAGVSTRKFHEEMARYLVHGILHLCGYDHHALDERRRMRALERQLWKAIWANEHFSKVSGLR